LGASIAIKDMKASTLKISSSLWLLSIFGFSHGTHEWVELFLLVQSQYLGPYQIFLVKSFSIFIAFISFSFLLWFGLLLVFSFNRNQYTKWLRYLVIGMFLYFFYYFYNSLKISNELFLLKMDIMTRRTVGLLGSLVTSYALIAYSRALKKVSQSISVFFLITGVGFFFYGFFAGYLPSHVKIPIFDIPVQFFRAISAVLITYFLMKGLNIFDIETRYKLEQQIKKVAQSEKMASLGRLASGIAHEVNTPLTSASLNVQMLRNKLKSQSATGAALKKLDAIERNITRASVIAKELLQFSHMKEVILTKISIEEVISNALEPLEYQLQNISVVRNNSNLPDILGDMVKLEQVFINIFNNSIEAMPAGGKLSISSGIENGKVWIKIIDTGIGIKTDMMSNVFEPFFTTKDIGKGTGLGLSICFGIMENHHGTIELSGEKDKGATVTLQFPIPVGKT